MDSLKSRGLKMQFNNRNQLVIIVGPTGVGKTELSLRLAAELRGEIVSADSRLFYRGMDIGTAKPTIEERNKIPHHLIDACNPDETWSLSVFQQKAYQAIHEIHLRNQLPFLVGGTGQYVRSVADGWLPPKIEPDERLRFLLNQIAQEIGTKGLHNKLYLLDEVAAEKIDPRNVRRTVRALEVILKTGRRFSDQRGQEKPPFSMLTIGFTRPRTVLYKRIDDRVDQMVRNGLILEVQKLLDEGYSSNLPSMSAIGYREITWYLEGKMSLEDAVTLIKSKTHQFVRRQANWFKLEDENIHWFDLENLQLEPIIDQIKKFVEE